MNRLVTALLVLALTPPAVAQQRDDLDNIQALMKEQHAQTIAIIREASTKLGAMEAKLQELSTINRVLEQANAKLSELATIGKTLRTMDEKLGKPGALQRNPYVVVSTTGGTSIFDKDGKTTCARGDGPNQCRGDAVKFCRDKFNGLYVHHATTTGNDVHMHLIVCKLPD